MDIEVAITHGNDYHGEEFNASFVNGQHTTQIVASTGIQEAFVKRFVVLQERLWETSDIGPALLRQSSVRVIEPVFESQTKTKLGSQGVDINGPSMQRL